MTNNPTTTATTTYRLILFNACAFAGVAWATKLGYVEQVFNGDISGISYGITALFAAGLVATVYGKAALLERMPNWLVTLGLIGNVVGFVLALRDIDPSALSGGAPEVVANLLGGMGVAFYSTLVGAIAALWIEINGFILGGAK